MTPMNLRGVGYVGLDVPDVAAWTDFATGVIGLMPVDPPAGGDAAGDAYFTSDDRQWRVALHRSDRAHPDRRESLGPLLRPPLRQRGGVDRVLRQRLLVIRMGS